jgi:hypothetical protein
MHRADASHTQIGLRRVEQDVWEDGSLRFVSVRHDGFRSLGLWHQRQVAAGLAGTWEIRDLIYPLQPLGTAASHTVSLHWLLPDWPWEVQPRTESPGFIVTISSPLGPVQLLLETESAVNHPLSQALLITRAGERVWGEGGSSPVWGWSSPTYGVKIPALSLRLILTGSLPLGFTTKFTFPLDLKQEGQ